MLASIGLLWLLLRFFLGLFLLRWLRRGLYLLGLFFLGLTLFNLVLFFHLLLILHHGILELLLLQGLLQIVLCLFLSALSRFRDLRLSPRLFLSKHILDFIPNILS